jgi:cell division septal protein FtsQ
MTERQVRNTARPTYGRSSMRPPRRRGRRVVNPFGPTTKRFLFLAVFVIISLFILRQFFVIKTIKVTTTTRSTEIQLAATESIHSSWWQSDLITFNADTLAAKLRASDPMISSISVQRHWPNAISLNVILKQPSIGWSSGNQVYLIDHDGTAIGSMPAGSVLPVVIDGSNLPVTIGQRVVSTKFVAYIEEVIPALAVAAVKVTKLEVKDTTLDLYVTTDKGYYLILDTGREVNDTISDLKLVITALAAQKRVPSTYIDLRIPSKAYYK